MDDQGELSTFFPLPPPFHKHFTRANLDKLQEIKEDLVTNREGNDEERRKKVSQLSVEIRTLIPPRPPKDGLHKLFGAKIGGPDPTLEEMGAEQLFPGDTTQDSPTAATSVTWTKTRATHLKTLTQSIMLNFLELTGIMAQNPEHASDKIADLEVLFLNAHSIVNEYRPHQARDELIWTLRERLQGIEDEIEGVKKAKLKNRQLFEELSGEEPRLAETKAGSSSGAEHRSKLQEEAQDVWQALDIEVEP